MTTLADLNLDVLHLITKELCDEGIAHALILSRVSRPFNIVATRFIYRSVIYRAYPDVHSRKTDLDLLHRLLDNRILRAHVHSFTVRGSSRRLFDSRDYVKKLKPIVRLVSMLPHLQSFTWATCTPPPEGLGSALQKHNRGPQFHLSLVDCRAVSSDLLDKQCLISLDASVRVVGNRQTKINVPIFEIQKILFQSPNLQSFNLVMLNSHGGGLHGSLPARFAANFQLSGHEKFPPLEHLMLVDYSICTPERALWRDKMDWQRLTSLTLKGQAIGNLALMRGLVKNLKVLRLHGWSWVNGDRRVTEFIHSFKGLEEIELDGFYVSAYTLGMHPDLKSLSVRTPGYRVANHWGTFYAGEIRELHTRCTRIRYLDLEIYGSIEQSHDVISVYAAYFPDLRHFHLRIHCWNNPRKQILIYEAMGGLVDTFFRIRKRNRDAADAVNDAVELAPFISLSFTLGKVTRTYQGPPSS